MSTPSRADRRALIHARGNALAGSQARARVARGAVADDDAAPRHAELWLYGVVGGYWWGFNSETVADDLRGLDVDQITVRLHSPGGNAIDGIAIGNLLRNHKATITVVVDGLAASAASVIALAGDEVVMSPGSQMMLHDPWMLSVGNAAELRSDADFLDKQAENYAGVYALRGGGTAEAWRTVMLADNGRGTWYTAQEAVDAGLADRVGTVVSTTPPPAEPTSDPDLDDDEMAARAAWDLEVLVHPAARAAWRPTKPPAASAEGTTHTDEGVPAMAFTPEQVTNMRQELGLPETADEATIVAALAEALAEQATETPAATVPEGHVVIPAAKLADLEAGAEQARTTATALHVKERTAFLDSVRDKYLPSSRAGWESEYDRDEAGVRAHFASAPVLIPTSELGKGDDSEAGLTPYDELYGNQQKGA